MLVLFSHFGYNEINIHRPTYILLLIVFVACDAFWSSPQLISAANDKIQRNKMASFFTVIRTSHSKHLMTSSLYTVTSRHKSLL